MWLGVTVEDQPEACGRIPILLDIPRMYWLSCESLLDPLELRPWLGPGRAPWVIIGGERAGKAARPMRPEWRGPR